MKTSCNIIIMMSLFVLAACNKDRIVYKQPNYESINSNVLCYQALYDLVRLCDGVVSQNAFTGTTQPVTFTKDSLNGYIIAHLNFNDTLTLHSDLRKRSGKIDVKFKKPYFVLNSIFEVDLKNYNVNGYQFNGNVNYSVLFANNNNKYIKLNTTGLNVNSINNNYTIASDITINSLSFYSSYVKGNISAKGNLVNYSSSSLDSLYITTRFFYKSKIAITCNEFNATLNYGDGQNDTLATATIDKIRYIINLKNF